MDEGRKGIGEALRKRRERAWSKWKRVMEGEKKWMKGEMGRS